MIKRSTFDTTKQNGRFSVTACRNTRSAPIKGPSAASYTTNTPLHKESKAFTSSLKFTCLGLSIKLSRWLLPRVFCIWELMGIILSETSCLDSPMWLSLKRGRWRNKCGDNLWDSLTNTSSNVVFLWCRWPTTVTFLISSGVYIKPAKIAVLYLVDLLFYTTRPTCLFLTGAMMGTYKG
jgi:hypothetical protein